MTTLGIDPGLSGAIALLDERGDPAWCEDTPTVTVDGRREIDGKAVARLFLLAACYQPLVVIEDVPEFLPGDQQRSRQVARLHDSAGYVRGIAVGAGFEVRELTPLKWRAVVMPTTPARRSAARAASVTTKDESLAVARRLYPTMELHLAKHDGRAEALLIARAGWLLWRGERRVA